MAFQADRYADEIKLYAATPDQPDAFKPMFHVHWDEHLSWLRLDDGLPSHAHFGAQAGLA